MQGKVNKISSTGEEGEDLGKNIAVDRRSASFALFYLTWPWPKRQNGSCIREELKLNRGDFQKQPCPGPSEQKGT